MNSPSDAHADHLRHLLDQRTARADVHAHTRFPSLSEFSDTPSVYSHPFFSPRPTMDKAEADGNAHPYGLEVPYSRSTCASPMSNRQRLNDPNASMLDLDDDSRSSIRSVATYDDDQRTINSMEYESDSDDEPQPRMSLLGPKMRFHGPAPWETSEDPLQEEDEPEDEPRPSFTSKRGRGRSAKGDGIMKTLGLGSSSRPSTGSRPSIESNRSQGKSKRSLESGFSLAPNPHGALL